MFQIDTIDIIGHCLLFILVFGMSATVDIVALQAQLKNRNAILTGVFLQVSRTELGLDKKRHYHETFFAPVSLH